MFRMIYIQKSNLPYNFENFFLYRKSAKGRLKLTESDCNLHELSIPGFREIIPGFREIIPNIRVEYIFPAHAEKTRQLVALVPINVMGLWHERRLFVVVVYLFSFFSLS